MNLTRIHADRAPTSGRRKVAALAAAAAALTLVPLTAVPALAATPGSPCTLILLAVNNTTPPPTDGQGVFVTEGRVSNNGATCVPNSPLTEPLAAANLGVPCNAAISLENSDGSRVAAISVCST